MSYRVRQVVLALVIAMVVSVTATPSISTSFGDPAAPADQHLVPHHAATSQVPQERFDLSAVHDEGVTGEGVRVGVIGRRFAAETGPIAGHVSGSKHFAGAGAIRFADGEHDTAVAEIVANTAPDARLYLAGVGSRPSPEEYRRAVRWLVANDVDVIVDAASYFPPSAEGMTKMNRVATNATRQGVVFVTSAGNYADRHWSETVSGDGWVEFTRGAQVNPLGNGTIQGQVTLRLYWTTEADYDLYLYRRTPGPDDPVVAKSVARQAGPGTHAEAIDVRVPTGQYYVAIHAHDGAAGRTTLDLFSATTRLKYTVADGSMVAPATAENVIAVGALSGETGEPRSYSSRSGELDLAAPDGSETSAGRLFGTSAAAPLVAGTAALMESREGDLSPAEAERILESTAMQSDGQLRVDPVAAVRAAEHGTLEAEPTPETPVVPDTAPALVPSWNVAEPGSTGTLPTAENESDDGSVPGTSRRPVP